MRLKHQRGGGCEGRERGGSGCGMSGCCRSGTSERDADAVDAFTAAAAAGGANECAAALLVGQLDFFGFEAEHTAAQRNGEKKLFGAVDYAASSSSKADLAAKIL